MKFLSLILCFCITLNVFAATTPIAELEKEYDDFQYAITVEWDQKDNAFYESKVQEFTQKIYELGVTEKDILALAKKKGNSAQTVEAIKAKLAIMGEMKTPEDLALALRSSKGFYHEGASWNEDIMTYYLPIAFIIGLVLYIQVTNSDYECVEWADKWICESTASGNSTVSECGWQKRCVREEKKQK